MQTTAMVWSLQMQCVCTFIPGNAATKESIDKLLLPDECVRQLSQIANSQQIYRSLPHAMSVLISELATQGLNPLLRQIHQSPERAEWIALSSTPRAVPTSSDQLQAYPMLKQRLEHDLLKAKPAMERKIVVEVAGQPLSNEVSVMLSSADGRKSVLRKPHADVLNDHRSLVEFTNLDESAYRLSLSVPKAGLAHTLTFCLANDVFSVGEGHQQSEWDTVLVPVMPIVMQQGKPSRPCTGFMYLVWNHRVWREMEVTSDGHFVDVDLEYYRAQSPEIKARYVQIDGARLSPDVSLAEAEFEVIQSGVKVHQGYLDSEQTACVSGLLEKTVDVVFPALEARPVTLATHVSHDKGGEHGRRVAEGVPLSTICVPYKVAGERQSECYLYYSGTPLSLTQIADLERDPAALAVPLAELAMYSRTQSFANAGQSVSAVPDSLQVGGRKAPDNEHLGRNIAAVKVSLNGHRPSLRYLYEPDADKDDDFFALRSLEHQWMYKSFMCSACEDEDGYRTFYFALPPPEIETVDLIRGGQPKRKDGSQAFILIEENIPVEELLSEWV
ncbi:hypothetical protein ACODM8_19510 [Vibrio ostreicida]|uniref:hypothetical protein n=1 Tax=Vibrio ostreicida TaxID=526588 RepID=UPI003B58C786